MSKYRQHRERMNSQIFFLKALIVMLLFLLSVIVIGHIIKDWKDAEWQKNVVSPLASQVYAMSRTPTPAPVPEPTVENVMAYIGRKDKFGKYGPYVAARASMCFVTEGMSAAKNNVSHVDTRRVNYNCQYVVNGKKISTSCPPQDYDKAWSVDCGIAQINVAGKVCPEKLFDFRTNIDTALEKYEARGDFSAWYGKGCN